MLNAGIYPCEGQPCDIYQTENLIGFFWLIISGSWLQPDKLLLFCSSFHFFTSSSFSSKDLSRCWGITSLKPFCRARNWASMPCRKRQFTYNLEEKHEPENERPPTPTNWEYHVQIYVSVFIPDILLLGVLWYWNCLAIWFELVLDDFSISIVLNTESMIQDTSDVIIPEKEGKTKNCFELRLFQWNYRSIVIFTVNKYI